MNKNVALSLVTVSALGFILSAIHLVSHHFLGFQGLMHAPGFDIFTNTIACIAFLMCFGTVHASTRAHERTNG